MKIAPLVLAMTLAVAGSTACSSNLFGNGDAGAARGDASSGDAAAIADAGAATGAGCTDDLGGGIKLCTYISVCPTLGVDHDLYPNCGFRIRGAVIDLECVCQGMLCPMGAPTTCTQAAQLMTNQNEIQICLQVDEGRCTKL